MVYDRLENLDNYQSLHPSFPKVFAYLKTLDFNQLQVGRVDVDDDFYINVDEVEMRDMRTASLEVHNEYIDIQIPISQDEMVGYKPRINCKLIKEIKLKKDYILYKDFFDFTFPLKVGGFAIFFQNDAHAPIIGRGITKKIVVKVKK